MKITKSKLKKIIKEVLDQKYTENITLRKEILEKIERILDEIKSQFDIYGYGHDYALQMI